MNELKQQARHLAKNGKPSKDIAKILGVSEALVRQWTGTIKANKHPSTYDPEYLPQPPAKSTSAAKGTQERLDVMRERASRGEELYHPGDSKEVTVRLFLGRMSTE